jgi:hypothetical protein
MALDDKGDRKRSTFFTDTTSIFCDGELVSGRADVTVGSTIRARTIYDPASDSLVPARGRAWIGEEAPGKTSGTIVSFRLLKVPGGVNGANDDGLPYPVGTYNCELSIDGETEDSVDFAIEFPDCPVLPPVSDQPCRGWVRAGSVCDGTAGRVCECAPSGVWQCGS